LRFVTHAHDAIFTKNTLAGRLFLNEVEELNQ
jgi:hypothetical protein